MKRSRRYRILRGAAIALLVLVIVGAYAYFIGTRAILSQAENFAFRRMLVTQLENQDEYRFFYVSNRRLVDPAAPVDDRFLSERSKELSFGFFDTAIEPSLGVGMLLNASDWFLNEEIQLRRIEQPGFEDTLEQLRAQVEASPRRSLLLVVHGFREAFPSALRKTAFLAHVLDIDTPVLVFDWPGDQGSSLRGYRRARVVAEESGQELARVIRTVVDDIRPERLWLIANSMGGQVVVDAFDELQRDAAFVDDGRAFENVILTAPDVGHEEFNTSFRDRVTRLAKNTTVYVSSNDRALLVSRLINRNKRLGESSLDPSNPGQVQQAAKLSELMLPGDERLVLVDVTPVNRTRNFHNFSLETPEFFDDLFLRLTGTELPETRELYFLETPHGVRYFVLTRGR